MAKKKQIAPTCNPAHIECLKLVRAMKVSAVKAYKKARTYSTLSAEAWRAAKNALKLAIEAEDWAFHANSPRSRRIDSETERIIQINAYNQIVRIRHELNSAIGVFYARAKVLPYQC